MSHYVEKQYVEKAIIENGEVKEHASIVKQNVDGDVSVRGNVNGMPLYYQSNSINAANTPFRHFTTVNQPRVSFDEDEAYSSALNGRREPNGYPSSVTMRIVRMPTPYPKSSSRRSATKKRMQGLRKKPRRTIKRKSSKNAKR